MNDLKITRVDDERQPYMVTSPNQCLYQFTILCEAIAFATGYQAASLYPISIVIDPNVSQ